MVSFYLPDDARRMARRAQISGALAVGIAVAAFIACVTLCFFVRTGTAAQLLKWVIGLSVLAGWGCILILAFVHYPARAEAEHISHILAETPTVREGVLTVEKTAFHIPKSVDIRRAVLTEGEESTALHVLSRCVGRLPTVPVRVRVYTVRKFITGFEVCDEENE
jgi:hypothetical protein